MGLGASPHRVAASRLSESMAGSAKIVENEVRAQVHLRSDLSCPRDDDQEAEDKET